MTIDKDYMGALASSLCLIHCVLPPLLLMFGVSWAGFAFIDGEKIHYVLVAPILFFALWSIPKGLKSHQHVLPAILAAAGVCLLISGLLFEASEVMLTSMASLLLISAHLYNKKLLSKNVGYKT